MLWKSFDDDAISRIHSVKDTGIGIKQQNQEKNISIFCARRSSTTENWWNRLRFTTSNQLLALMNSKLLLRVNTKGSDFHFIIDFKKSDKKKQYYSVS
jgi:light-regulated signal transduction histidine kinase (bacteriophytochrome)